MKVIIYFQLCIYILLLNDCLLYFHRCIFIQSQIVSQLHYIYFSNDKKELLGDAGAFQPNFYLNLFFFLIYITSSLVGLGQLSHLQVDLLDAVHVVSHEAEDEAAQTGCDADAHQQQLLVGVRAKALLHVLHLQMGRHRHESTRGRGGGFGDEGGGAGS